MAFPSNLGMGTEALARLATQAAWEIGKYGFVPADVRYALTQRVPGVTRAALDWAIGVARRSVTAVGRASAAGAKATFGSLFRGNRGLSPGYSVVVSVTATFPDGEVRTGRYLIDNVVNADTVQSARDRAVQLAQAPYATGQRFGSASSRCRLLAGGSTEGIRFQTEVVSIYAASGTP